MVVHVTTGLTPRAGGPYVSVAGLVRALVAENGCIPVVVAPVAAPPAGVDRTHWSSAAVFTLPPGSSNAKGRSVVFGGRGRFLRAAVPSAPSIVHLHGLWDSGTFVAADLAGLSGVRFVVSPRGMLEPWALRHKWLKKKAFLTGYLRSLLAASDLLHATSEAEADSLRSLGFRQPIAVIANGVDCSQALERCDVPVEARRRLLYLGRLHVKKGLENLLRAWAMTRPPNWQLSIAGLDEGGYQSRLESLAESLGITDSIDFPGAFLGADKWDYLARGTAFVHPSFSENFGIAVAEALAAGLPVIATVGTPWQMLPAERCGWWVDPTPDALAAAIDSLTSCSDSALGAMGDRARTFAGAKFGWRQIGRDMTACYRWLTDRGPAPECVRFA
jgi:glycosyltransferase involved in cell wall biosynthesis